jgi:hypothetical protein
MVWIDTTDRLPLANVRLTSEDAEAIAAAITARGRRVLCSLGTEASGTGSLAQAASRGTLWGRVMPENAMHVTLAGDRAGDYLIEEELPDGRLLLRPDGSHSTVVPAFSGRAATAEEFERILGILPTDGEG